jgi:hypothetical protein
VGVEYSVPRVRRELWEKAVIAALGRIDISRSASSYVLDAGLAALVADEIVASWDNRFLMTETGQKLEHGGG